MTLRTLHNSKFRISIAACALAGGFFLGACGGGPSDDGAGGANPAGGDVGLDQASDREDTPAADASEGETATVVLGGTTYEFQSGSGSAPDGDPKNRTFCSSLVGGLQGELRLVDESGEFVEDGRLSFGLAEPDSDMGRTGVDQTIEVTLPSAPDVDGSVRYSADADTIESEVSGSSATASFTAQSDSGDQSGTIEVSC